MTSKEDTEADKFVQMIRDNAPEHLRGQDIVVICAGLIGSYADDINVAAEWLSHIVKYLREYYDAQECMCPKCTARRKAEAH